MGDGESVEAAEATEEEARGSAPNFAELVDLDTWLQVEDYLEQFDGLLSDDVAQAIELKRRLREELASGPELRDRIHRVSEEDLAWARGILVFQRTCAHHTFCSVRSSFVCFLEWKPCVERDSTVQKRELLDS